VPRLARGVKVAAFAARDGRERGEQAARRDGGGGVTEPVPAHLDAERTREELRRARLELLNREREHAASARALLDDLRATPSTAPEILAEATRSAELAQSALRLGVVDTHRVGATLDELAEASGLTAEQLETIVRTQTGGTG
jgi:hypothetical protein